MKRKMHEGTCKAPICRFMRAAAKAPALELVANRFHRKLRGGGFTFATCMCMNRQLTSSFEHHMRKPIASSSVSNGSQCVAETENHKIDQDRPTLHDRPR